MFFVFTMRTKREIEKKLQGVKGFLGCYSSAADAKPLPSLQPGQSVLVHELIDIDQALGHWIGVKISLEGDVLFFDSRGLKPDGRIKRDLSNQAKRKGAKLRWSSRRVQSVLSSKCGEFAVMFVILVESKKTFREFLELFSRSELLFNDKIVENFISLWKKKKRGSL